MHVKQPKKKTCRSECPGTTLQCTNATGDNNFDRQAKWLID